MNTRLATACILSALAALASAPARAASTYDSPIIFSIHTLSATSNGGIRIERGMDREDVSWAMKYKSHVELSPDVWVFTGYRADLDLANQRGCDKVVITFVNDKVADLQLVNRPAVGAIAANLRANYPARDIASR
jgi:hypothetical protein